MNNHYLCLILTNVFNLCTVCRFSYEEEVHPEDFFLPYLWSLLMPRVPIHWRQESVRLC